MGWVESGDGTSSTLLRVVDKDVDLKPDTPDFIIVNVRINYDYSDIRLRETGASTEIFGGNINPKTTSNLVYHDKTTPNSKSSTIFIKITLGPSFIDKLTESSSPSTEIRGTTESSDLQIQITN